MSCDVFISYATENAAYAAQLYHILKQRGVAVWFAPACIGSGDDFVDQIGNSIGNTDLNDRQWESLKQAVGARSMIFLLSRYSMESVWCGKELKMAISNRIPIQVLQLDDAPLDPSFSLMLVDVQILKAKSLSKKVVQCVFQTLEQSLDKTFENVQAERTNRITIRDLEITEVVRADPWYEDERTIDCRLSNAEFYLSPPADRITAENAEWATAHFCAEDHFPDVSLESIQEQYGIPDLKERIERARREVFEDFCQQKNGCYFNNKKYGVRRINPFARTEDISEMPVLALELFTTDYFTHRVMKAVCKKMYSENHPFIFQKLDFTKMESLQIFFTSLGINLLLLDADGRMRQNTILTVRSTNSSETYGKEKISLSVIEGVSATDYDPYRRRVSLSSAVERGLLEELGVDVKLLDRTGIKFYGMFLNRKNWELGISCSAELKNEYSLTEHVLSRAGKDDVLEVADKKVISVEQLPEFVRKNVDRCMEQAVFTIDSFLRIRGVELIDRRVQQLYRAEKFVQGKLPDAEKCEDVVYQGDHYAAVIDGVTAKGKRLYANMSSGRYAARLLAEEMEKLAPDLTAQQAVAQLNRALAEAYDCPFSQVEVEDRLQAAVIMYSKARREVWSFGDCQAMINETVIRNPKRVDELLSHVRALYLELYGREEVPRQDCALQTETDSGREYIMPLLRRQAMLANTNSEFGYDILDGGAVNCEHVKVYPVREGDHIVLASDGYPKIFSSLAESEQYLQKVLLEDPQCVCQNLQTKGLKKEQLSFDDRAYLSFFA